MTTPEKPSLVVPFLLIALTLALVADFYLLQSCIKLQRDYHAKAKELNQANARITFWEEQWSQCTQQNKGQSASNRPKTNPNQDEVIVQSN